MASLTCTLALFGCERDRDTAISGNDVASDNTNLYDNGLGSDNLNTSSRAFANESQVAKSLRKGSSQLPNTAE